MAKILATLTPERAALAAEATTLHSDTIQARKNIRNLSDAELAALREAFRQLYAIQSSDERSYQYIAGLHGLPLPVYCSHGTPLFAVWHRPYIYMLEKALQDRVPGVTLPYWDWTSRVSQSEGIPTALTDTSNDNPLLKAAIEFQGSQFTETFRQPGPVRTLRQLARDVSRAQRISTTYSRYSQALEQPHNAIHGWVGGTMGIVSYAAYDPIFWAHHCNVDRLFAEWQARHPNIRPTNDIWNTVLQPFNMTTAQIWDIHQLGYEYLTAEVSLAESSTFAASAAAAASKFAARAPIAGFSLGGLEPDFDEAGLEFYNVQHPKNSFEVRVFLNQDDADARTPIENNDRYAGSLYFFGHGECAGDAGHCDPSRGARGRFDLRPPYHLNPFTLYLDATECVKKMADAGEVTVKLVAVDSQGNPVEEPGTDCDAIALVTS